MYRKIVAQGTRECVVVVFGAGRSGARLVGSRRRRLRVSIVLVYVSACNFSVKGYTYALWKGCRPDLGALLITWYKFDCEC